MQHHECVKKWIILAFMLALSLTAKADSLDIVNDIQTYSSLTNTTVNMSGKSELHITSGTNPIPGCQINLNSSDSWFFLEQIKPSEVISTYLSQVQVDGSPAVLNSNVRVDQYVNGTVVIPHSPSYHPLQVYSGYFFSGTSQSLGLYTYYKGSGSLVGLNNAISSFKLKRGYMAAFAQGENGSGISRVYTAQDSDINIPVMPEELNDSVSFVRVIPWRWTSKKGWAGGGTYPVLVDSKWNYDWDNVAVSTLDMEYVPMRHNAGWNAYSNINNKQGSTAALAFNEPDKSDQANMTVAQAIDQWPNLMVSGLRIGSPATSDGGLSWLYDFIDEADARNYRVDFVAAHYYHDNESISTIKSWLSNIYSQTGRPVWVTEWNDGCNWTGGDPTSEAAHAARIAEIIDALDDMPFVERYAIYNACSNRELIISSSLTLAGEVYLDHEAPISYAQEPGKAGLGCAYYTFDDNALDSLFYEHNGAAQGRRVYITGHDGQAIDLDGVSDYVTLPANLANSDDFTFAAWVYWDGGSQWQRIFDFGHNSTKYMFLTPNSSSSTLRFAITTSGYGSEQVMQTSQLATGQWVHVAVTLNGNTGKLFVNGSQVAINTSMTINPSDLNTMTNYLGRSHFGVDPLFNGRLDEVHITDYALTNTQITALYNGTLGNVAPVFLSDPIVKTNALRESFYRDALIYNTSDFDANDMLTFSKISGPSWLQVYDDGTIVGIPGPGDVGVNSFTVRVTDGSGAYDEATLNITVYGFGIRTHYNFENNTNDSIGSNHGTATGSPVYTTGKIGQAIVLDGTDDYVTIPAGLVNTDDITIAAWVYWNSGDQWQRIFDFGNGTGQYMFLTPRSGSNTLRFAIKKDSSEQILQTTQLATGQWVYIAVTLSGSVGKLYVDGVLKNTDNSMTINPSDFNPVFNYIGDSQFSADPLFNGLIDDFRIFNYALSATDIATLANGAANNPPSFTSDPIIKQDAIEDSVYSGPPLTAEAVDLDGDELTFSKVNGPAWLNVASAGSLSGIPADSDVGNNEFTVLAEDTYGLSDTAGMNIYVYNVYSGVRGMEDLMGLINRWLNTYCIDIACNGADLDGDSDVDFFDFARLANNWQIE